VRTIPAYRKRWRQLLETLLPLALGLLAVRAKSVLAQLGESSASTLLLALVVIVFLIPQLRRYAFVVICFGVSVFAFHRMWQGAQAVDWHQTVWTDYAVVGMWLGIAILSGLAGIGEVWFGSAIWSQQCYLLAVALYFMGHGGAEWLRGRHLFSAFLTLVGTVALAGVVWVGARKRSLSTPSPRPSRRGVRWMHGTTSLESHHPDG